MKNDSVWRLATYLHAPIRLLKGNTEGATVHRAIFAILATGVSLSVLTFAAVKIWAACDYNNPPPTEPYVCTEFDDYPPGAIANISGTGFWPGETVELIVLHADGAPSDGEDHEPWYVEADAEGSFVTTWHVCEDDCVGETLELTATGLSSGLIATTRFTDLAFTLHEDAARTIKRDAFAWGSTVFARIAQARNDTCYRVEWINPSGTVVETHNLPGTSGASGNANRDDSFVVPSTGPSGIWTAKEYAFANGNFNCTGTPTLDATAPFDVARAVIVGAGTTGTDTVGGDNDVNQNQPTTVQSPTSATMGVDSSTGSKNKRSFVRLDLTSSGVSGSVTDAKLRLLLMGSPNNSRTHNAHRVTAAWAENTITWNNQPSVAASPTDSKLTGTANNTLLRWAVTSDVNGFVNGSLTNNGWRISDATEDASGSNGTTYRTTEASTTDKTLWPVLLVDYTSCTPPATPAPSNDGPICSGQTLNLFANTAADGYIWSGPNSFSSSDQNPSIANATTAATGTYDLKVVSGSCTSAVGQTSATVNELPSCSIMGPDPVCAYTTNTYMGVTGTDLTNLWSVSFATILATYGEDGSKVDVTVPGATANLFTLNLTVSNTVTSCKSSCSTNITVHFKPWLTTNPTNLTVCAGATASFSAAATGDPTPTLQWQADSGGGFTNIPGATSSPLSFTTSASQNGDMLRAIFENSCGAATSQVATLTVNAAPQITCPGTITSNTAPGQCSASVTFNPGVTGSPTPTVVCKVDSTVITSPHTFPLGTTNVTCTAMNSCGTDSCSFTVTVEDHKRPSISCPADITSNAAPYDCAAVVNFTVTASDNCDGTLSPSCTTNGAAVASGATFPTGTNAVVCTATDTAGNSTNCSFMVTVNPRPTMLTYTGDTSVEYGSNATFRAELKDSLTSTGVTNKLVTFTLCTQTTNAVTDANGIAEVSMVVTQLPGTCTNVIASWAGDCAFAPSSVTNAFSITQQGAQPVADAFYTGKPFYWTTGPNSTTATLELVATLRNRTGFAGDITNAKVSFCVRNGTNLTAIVGAQNLPVGLVNPGDTTVGTASAVVQYNIGKNNTAAVLDIAVKIGGGVYSNDNAAADAMVMIAVPVPNGQICGGGTIETTGSAGYLQGPTGGTNDFCFYVKYNNKGTNPQGYVELTVRSYNDRNGVPDTALRTYKLRSNAINVLAVNSGSTTNNGLAPHTAQFSSKANVAEIVNGSEQSIEGNCIMNMTLTDLSPTGPPTAGDTLGVTVYRNKGGVWFSSNWTGTNTAERAITSGNVSVK
jgi:hypothetical protein